MTAIHPLDGLTIGGALRHAAASHPYREAFVFWPGGLRVTYAEYDRMVDDVARSLLSLGIRRGETVAVWATNCPEWPVLFMAASRIGAVFVSVDPAGSSDELARALRRSAAKALFVVDRSDDFDYPGITAEIVTELTDSVPGLLEAAAFSALRWVICLGDEAPEGFLSWGDLLARGDAVPFSALLDREESLDPADPVYLACSALATDPPEHAMASHRGVLDEACSVRDGERVSSGEGLCVAAPFHHWYAKAGGVVSCMARGATMLVPGPAAAAEDVLEFMRDEHATALVGLPEGFGDTVRDGAFPSCDIDPRRAEVVAVDGGSSA
jgi:fatty-acyl-CoA synthase